MAKSRHQPQEPASSRSTMMIMVAGALLVGALVVWSLTRTVEPSTAGDVAATDVSTAPLPSTAPLTSTTTTAPIVTTSPLSEPASGQTPPPQPAGDRSTVQRIAAEDLRAKMNRNEVTLLDVRDARAYALKHIAGSINVPFASVESMLDQIPKDKAIVTYCT